MRKTGVVVHKFLSSILSVCLLVSSVSPSLAQIVPFKAVSKAVAASGGKMLPAALQASLVRQIIEQQSLAELSAQGFVPAQISFTEAQALSAAILHKEIPQVAKIHNDWLGLAIKFEDIARADAPKARVLLRENLSKNQVVFSQIPYQDLDALLEVIGKKTRLSASSVEQTRQALAEASALALIGSVQDAPALLSFYHSAKGSIFEPTATIIAVRGLLRYGAYEDLNALLQEAGDLGDFGKGLSRYAQENKLPVRVVATEGSFQTPPAGLQLFLEKEGAVHGLQANASYEATRVWMELGRPKSATATAAKKKQTSQVTAAPKREPLEKIEIPAQTFLPQGITLTPQTPVFGASDSPKATPEAIKPAAPAKQPKPVSAATPSAADNSGVLYSGIPVFYIEQKVKKLLSSLKKRHEARVAKKNAPEEEGLHENNVHSVYEESAVAVSEAEDVFSAAEPESVAVEKDGYKLTLEDEQAKEHILHNVSLSVSPMLEQFSSLYNRLALTKEHIFELRNQVLSPIRPDHFFFALNPENGALETLIKGASRLNMQRPLRVKIQQTASPRNVVTLKFYGDDSLTDFIIADVDKALFPSAVLKKGIKGYLVQQESKVFYVEGEDGTAFALDKYFVRLPKGESRYWTKIFEQNPKMRFALNLYSTQEKTFAWTYLVPTMQIGLGKTMAPELSARTNLGESASTIIMLCINNVLPVLMGFVHKGLKRYGEAAIGRIGVGSFVAGSGIALASGLYGFLGDGLMSGWQTAGFVTSSVLIAVGTNITRFVQNILISANRGKIISQDSFKKTETKETAAGKKITYDGAYLWKRTKEVFTKAPNGSARDVVLFQTASMFKNLGTMLFLSFPWLANTAVKLTTGADLNLDFSASYVPYSLFGAYTLYKVCRTAYKDAFPTALNLLENNLQEIKQRSFREIFALKPEEVSASHPVIVNAAKQLKGAIDAISPVEAREKGGKTADIAQAHKEDVLVNMALQAAIQNQELSFAKQVSDALEEALENLGRREVKIADVAKMTGIPTSLAAMTLATFHELAVSNGFAFGMRSIVGHGATANALTALALYGSMSAGRILGNMLSRRVSGGTMYAVSSSMSVAGTALMAAANGNIAALIGGAIIASFGVGNFFSQMYEYMTGLYPKYRREIALLINYTMPAAAVMTFPMRGLVSSTGITNLDLIVSGAGLLASLALTPGMFANSSIIRAAQSGWTKAKVSLREILKRHSSAKAKSDNIDDALPN